MTIMEAEATYGEDFKVTSPKDSKRYLRCHFHGMQQEHFCCFFLNQRHKLISFETLFVGTIDGASVYPREVVRRAIELHAAAAIFAHIHPSGIAEPSRADERLTQRLRDALALIDVRVLDHLIVGGQDVVSFAERGEI